MMVPVALSSTTNLSTVSNTTANNMEIAENVKGFIQGTLHCQKHVLQWIPFIQKHFPERQKAIALLYKISQVVDTTLIRAYSIGGFAARANLVARGECVVEYGSYNYAVMQWNDGQAKGYLRATAGALYRVQHLCKLLTHFFNNNTPDYEDIDALLPKHSYGGKAPSHLLFQDASFLDQCVSLINKIIIDERQVHSSKQAARKKDLLRTITLPAGPQVQPSVGSTTTTTPPPVGSLPLPSPQNPKVPAPGAANLSSVLLDQAARAAIDKVHSDLLQQHAAALAAQTAAWDRAVQDKDRLLREERAKRKAESEATQLLLLQQHQQKTLREEQVKLQHQGYCCSQETTG